LSFAKQLSKRILEELEKEKRKLIIFTDFGSGLLEEINRMTSNIIICDHHQPRGEPGENVIHISSVEAGIDENISGSGVTYLLARTMSPKNIDLSSLAIIGAIGDSQIGSIGKDWGVSGLNREILKDSESQGKIKVSKGLRIWGRYRRPIHKALEYSIDPYIPGISGSESSAVQFLQEIGIPVKKENKGWTTISDLSLEDQKKLATEIIKERIRGEHSKPEEIFGDVYELLDKEGVFRDANEFASMLNACGKMGRADLGVCLCLNQSKAFEEVENLLDEYKREIGKALSWVYEQIEKKSEYFREGNGIYILAGKSISEHIISNVISTVNHSGILPEKPLFGFADSEEGSKVSARANTSLTDKGFNISEIVSEVASKLGGEGGGHLGAAGATIPKGKEEEFINFVEQMITNKNNRYNKQDIEVKGKEGDYGKEGKTEAERGETSNEGGREDRGSQTGGEGKEDTRKEMEGKGLVQYFGP
jgi:RecJ-like exonuclease